MIIEKESCWSIIKIDTKNNILNQNILDKIYLILDNFEKKYSRFIVWNFLYNLNKSWKSIIDDEFKTLFRVCDVLNKVTNWFFDITILPFLENYGYWIEKLNLDENIWMDKIKIIWNEVFLKEWVKIDFWSIWKGYLVDQIYNLLIKEIDFFTINFWWDIRVGKQDEIIWLEDPFDDKKIIWEIKVSEESICSSNWQKRKFWEFHHLINPFSKKSQNNKISVYIKHKIATLADAYSTAIYITPLEKSLEIIEKTKWLEALIIAKNWEIYKSNWFNAIIY